MECAQLQITGGGSKQPATVSFPGAYKGTYPGIKIKIYQPLSNYTIPGSYPAVVLDPLAVLTVLFLRRPCRFHLLKEH